MDSSPVSEVDNASRVVHCVAINNARGIGAWEEFDGHFAFPRRFHVRLGLWRCPGLELQLPLHAGAYVAEKSRDDR